MYDTEDMPWDPNGVLSFMVQALQATEDAGDRAWIIGHIPPGVLDVFADQVCRFLSPYEFTSLYPV